MSEKERQHYLKLIDVRASDYELKLFADLLREKEMEAYRFLMEI